MLVDILKDPKFNLGFSFLMGVFLVLLLRPVCKAGSCFTYKAPPVKEITDHAYKIGDRCYVFAPKEAKCPSTGVIEPFQWNAAASKY